MTVPRIHQAVAQVFHRQIYTNISGRRQHPVSTFVTQLT